jgi:hypothetical protein
MLGALLNLGFAAGAVAEAAVVAGGYEEPSVRGGRRRYVVPDGRVFADEADALRALREDATADGVATEGPSESARDPAPEAVRTPPTPDEDDAVPSAADTPVAWATVRRALLTAQDAAAADAARLEARRRKEEEFILNLVQELL